MLKNWKEKKDVNYALIIDATNKISLEELIRSVSSIFSSVSNSCKIHFIFSEKSELLESILLKQYVDIHNQKDGDKLNFHTISEENNKIFIIENIYLNADKNIEYFGFLKLPIQVSSSFISKLIFTLNNYEEYYEIGEPGLVLPVCNSKVGNQHLVLPPELSENEVEKINNKIIDIFSDSTKTKWIMTGIGSNICYVVPRKILYLCGVPDDINVDGTTAMTNYIYKLFTNNYVSLVAGDTYVYFPDAETKISPTPSLPDAFLKECDTIYKKLGVLYKIHITTEYQRDKFIESLKCISTIADHVYVMDCSSSIKISAYLKENFIDLWGKIDKYEKKYSPTDDKRDYNLLLSLAEQDNCDWVLSLEGMETFPDIVNRATFDRLMCPPNERICAYAMPEFYMWDKENWRWDGIWLTSASVRLAKLFPNRKIMGNTRLASQSGYVPSVPKEYIKFCNVNLLVWTFSSPEERQEAFKYVSSVDPNQDWRYFLDEKTLQLYPYRKGMVTTYSPTNGADIKVFEWLDHVWSWSDSIILGDDRNNISEKEKTLIENFYGAKIIPCNMEFDFGKARNKLITNADTSHIFQLDIDERLIDPRLLCRLVASPVDAFMFSIDNLQKEKNKPPVITNTVRLFKHLNHKVKYWGYLHETIDDSIRELSLTISHSPVKLLHYGYLWMNNTYAYNKMQRYINLNLRQMTDFPKDPRAYYNLAMHLIEDSIYDTAFRLLNVCIVLSKGSFSAPILESIKVHLFKSLTLCDHLLKSQGRNVNSKDAKEFANYIGAALQKIISFPVRVAEGHAANYFSNNKVESDKLNNLLFSIEKELNMI